MCSEAPDMSGVNRAAEENADIAREAMAFYRQLFDEQTPLRERAADTANQISLAQARAMNTATDLAQRADEQGRPFREAERVMLSDAMKFDTEAERERLAGMALGDVNDQFASAKEQSLRALQRTGVNPADGSYSGAVKQLTLGQALAGADAKNKARSQAQATAYARKMDALSLARGLPAQQATQQQIAMNAGNSAVSNAGQPLALSMAQGNTMGQGFNTATSANNSAGNLFLGAANVQQRADDNSGLWGALGQVGGAALFKYSDENAKEGKKPVSGQLALSQARSLPDVTQWRYKADSAGADGGVTHQGYMAQEVAQAMGQEAAPAGKAINLEAVASVGLAAIKQVDKEQQALKKRVLKLEDALR